MTPDPGLVAWVVFLVLGGLSLFAAIGMTITMSMYRAGLALMLSFLALAGLWLGFTAPEDYQQGDTVRIMFIHVPAAWMSMFVYACLGGASFLALVFRHALADAAAHRA